MALRPPSDFRPPAEEPHAPSEAELRAQWRRREEALAERRRGTEWRRALEGMRREGAVLRPSAAGCLPAYLREPLAYGPDSRGALRPAPRSGRVQAVGLDTWSPTWYAPPDRRIAGVLRALATEPVRRAWLLPDRLGPYRVGWFPDSGLVFAEGRPGDGTLLSAAALPTALSELESLLADLGIVVAEADPAGLRRLDLAADLRTDTAAEGLALLEAAASVPAGAEKLVTYRSRHCLETVLLRSRGGRTLARLYDKGAESGAFSRGRWLRLEAQWRFARDSRPPPEALTPTYLRARFKRRFTRFWTAAGGSGSAARRRLPSASVGRWKPAVSPPPGLAAWPATCS